MYYLVLRVIHETISRGARERTTEIQMYRWVERGEVFAYVYATSAVLNGLEVFNN